MQTPNPDALRDVCSGRSGVNQDTLEAVLSLAVEIAREGREGRKIGTLFVVGDTEAVLAHSRPLVLDPLLGHPDEARRVADPAFRETVKELAQLDGGFVVTDDGVAVSAARYIDASSDGVDIPMGLGSRHMAGASITLRTGAVAVVASESAVVRMFDRGEIVAEVIPEVWMLRRYAGADGLAGLLGRGAERAETGDGALVVSRPSDGQGVPVQERRRLALPVSDRDHRRGPDDAAVTVLMYGDFECPYCARVHGFLDTLLDERDDLLAAYRHYPLVRVHAHAQRAAEAAEAAGAQGQFWAMHDALIAHQDALSDDRIDALAAGLGLDLDAFREHLDTDAFADRVRADFKSGVRSGVDGTPALFVNGERYEGRLRLDPLRAAIEAVAG
ncbi:MAG: thioredoxin domain-containing protein [Bacteroidota bacterium]